MKESLSITRTEIKQPWGNLTHEYSIVIFCKGFGQAIVPFSEEMTCQSWAIVPPDQNILVAPASIVKNILCQDEGFGRGVEWCTRDTLIQSHHHGVKKPVIHTQSLRIIASPASNSQLKNEIESYMNSAFLFIGKAATKKCFEELRRGALEASNVFACLPTISKNKTLPELPASTNNVSTRADDSTFSDPKQNGLLASNEELHSQAENVSLEGYHGQWNSTKSNQFHKAGLPCEELLEAANSLYALDRLGQQTKTGGQPVSSIGVQIELRKRPHTNELRSSYKMGEPRMNSSEGSAMETLSFVAEPQQDDQDDDESKGLQKRAKGKERAV
jgi:hypothetical protein